MVVAGDMISTFTGITEDSTTIELTGALLLTVSTSRISLEAQSSQGGLFTCGEMGSATCANFLHNRLYQQLQQPSWQFVQHCLWVKVAHMEFFQVPHSALDRLQTH